jgi:hypothetical protein
MAGTAAGLALVMIAAGAVLTSGLAATPPLDSVALDSVALAGRIHSYLAVAVGALAVLVLASLMPTNTPNWVRGLGWAAVGVFAVEGGLSGFQTRIPLSSAMGIAHASLAPVLVALLAALTVFTMLDWSLTQPEPIDMSAWPLLAPAAKITPVLVLIQIVMGAAYRHKEWGVMPHMAGAMVVALALLVIPVVLLQKFGQHGALRPAAIAAMSVAILQIALGIGAFVMRLLEFDTTAVFVGIAAAHVAVGALTLAASLVLAIEVALCVETRD